MGEREDRIARNEALFRDVNERIHEAPPEGPAPELQGFLCECGNVDCTETILVSLDEYEAVRAEPTTFAVVPGHVIPDVEDVIAETERFMTVRKHPEEAAIAQQTDRRSNG